MGEPESGAVWVVRVWPEADDASGLRARITETLVQDGGENPSHRTEVAGSADEIERHLHEFLSMIVDRWRQQI